jgi:hypothetical protein
MNASYEAKADYIYIQLKGEYSNASAIELFRKWRDEAKRGKLYKVLCDLTQLIGFFPRENKPAEKFSTAELIALFLPKNITLAILAKPSQIEKDRFVEDLMRNRGVRVKLTPSREEALKWLKVK